MRLNDAAPLLVCALVLVAGCGGTTGPDASTTAPMQETAGTDTPTATTGVAPTTTEQPSTDRINVTENGAELGDVNATRVWERVGNLVSVDSTVPTRVVVEPASETLPAPILDGFVGSLGATGEDYYLENWKPNGRYEGGVYQPVVLQRPPNTSDAQMEVVLAHEFAHVYQQNAKQLPPENSSEVSERVVLEGTAELVEWRYADRYLDDYDPEVELERHLEKMPPVQRLGWFPYSHGARYARNYSEDGAPMASLYETQPTTGEQVLHGLSPGSEPPRPLVVRGDAAANWTWDEGATRRLGEPSLRYLLEIGLPPSRAADAAAGWGNDRRMRFTAGNETGWAWVVRWDDASEAREFEAAFDAYERNVSEPLAVRSVGVETTVLVSGNQSFVENATVSGTPSNVTVAA